MNYNNRSDNNDTLNELIVGAFLIAAFLFLLVTSLPAVIFAVIIGIVLMNVNIKYVKTVTLGVGVLTALLINSKVYKFNIFLQKAIALIKNVMIAIINKKTNTVPDIYKNYLFNINIVWQIIISIILASLILLVYQLKCSRKQEFEDEECKKKQQDKIADKIAEKLYEKKHPDDYTIIGADAKGQIDIEDKAKHIIIAGTTGAGKTVAISNFLENAMQKDYPVVAIDGKGDLDKGSLLHYMQELSKKYDRKLYVINFVKPEYSNLYNPFKDAGRTEAKDMLIGMNDWTEPHYKINTERYLQQLIKILNKKKIPLDLNTIINYSPNKFQELIEKMKDDNEIEIGEFTKISEIIKNTSAIINSAMARFATTAESEAGEIFNSQGIDIYTALKEKSSLLIILDSLGKPELSKQVGRLAVLDAKKAVSKLFGDTTRKFFVFDEFNVYASDIAIDLLNKSRSANITCIPAFQSLSDLDKAGGVALRNQVIENCNNYIIMRQNSPDSSREWEKVIGERDIYNYTYSIEENKSFLGAENVRKRTGGGSMYKTKESKFTASEIQNLDVGQAIFISKDQMLEKKIKVRTVKLEKLSPHIEVNNLKEIINADKDEPINNEEEPINYEEITANELADIEKLLNN